MIHSYNTIKIVQSAFKIYANCLYDIIKLQNLKEIQYEK